jgi:hypothetical protein
LRKRLWLGAAGVVLFLTIVVGARTLRPQVSAPTGAMGLDFVAFYTAGAAVREGRARELYDLDATNRFQQALQQEQGVAIGRRFAPWWNPPFYSLLFVPLSRLPFPTALLVWSLVSFLCATGACVLLCRILPPGSDRRSRALVPALILISTPFIATLTHGQNSCMSLLLLSVTVVLWRAGKPLAAGLAGGLLFFKPQLALVLAAVMLLDLGWRAALGYAITGTILLALNLLVLPGTLGAFVHQVPLNLDLVQSQSGYPWERQLTFKAFWRVLIQGNDPGATQWPAGSLGILCSCALGAMLARTTLKARAAGITSLTRNRLIAATVAMTPLLMPFYFDYDLLLLAVPAVLLAREFIRHATKANDVFPPLRSGEGWGEGRGRGAFHSLSPQPSPGGRGGMQIAVWVLLYLWIMVNPDVAERFHVNLSVPLLAVLSVFLLRHVTQTVERVNEAESPAQLWRSTSPQ